MSDLEARRLARELLRTGLDKDAVLAAVLDELDMPTRDAAMVVGRRVGAEVRYASETRPGVEFVPSTGPQHSVAVSVRPPQELHTITLTWLQVAPIKTPLDAVAPKNDQPYHPVVNPGGANPDEFGGVSEYEYDPSDYDYDTSGDE